MQIDGDPAVIHTQGLYVDDEHFYVTGRFEKTPKRALLLRFERSDPQRYEYIDITPRARQAHNTFLREEEPHHWTAHQKILDPEGNNEWAVECHIDLTRPRDDAMGEPLLDLRRIRG